MYLYQITFLDETQNVEIKYTNGDSEVEVLSKINFTEILNIEIIAEFYIQ